MSWFRLDDRMAFHRKIVAAGDEAVGAWVRAGAWSSGEGTEGFIPAANAIVLNRKPSVWARLCAVGLCEKSNGGYLIHDFLNYNPSAQESEDRRVKRAEAGTKGATKRWQKPWQPDGKHHGKHHGNTMATENGNRIAVAMANACPDPDPDPDPKEKEIPAIRPPAGDRADPVSEIHGHYQSVKKRHEPKSRPVRLEPKDQRILLEALKRGYSIADIKLACEGLFLSSHHLGENDRNTKYIEFRYVLKNLDAFIGNAERRNADQALAAEFEPEPTYGPPSPPTPEQLAMMAEALAPRPDPIAAFLAATPETFARKAAQ